MKKIMFVFGVLFGIALLVPIAVGGIDAFWYLLTGAVVFTEWNPARVSLLVLWMVVTFLVFAWAQRK